MFRFTALHGTDVVYLAKLYGHRQVKSPSRIGGRVPAYATAVGKAMLAFDAEALELTLARRLVRFTTATVPDADGLRLQLGDVRRTGLARETEEVVPGLACIAAPIFGPNGRPVAALSTSVTVDRLDTRRLEPILREVAAAATKRLSRSTEPLPRSRVARTA